MKKAVLLMLTVFLTLAMTANVWAVNHVNPYSISKDTVPVTNSIDPK